MSSFQRIDSAPALIYLDKNLSVESTYLHFSSILLLSGLCLSIFLFNVKFYLRRKRYSNLAFTPKHIFWGLLALLASVCCTIVVFWSIWKDRSGDWTRILIGILWILVCLSRIAYLTSSTHRQLSYTNSLLIGLALLLTAVLPQLYSMIWMGGRSLLSFSGLEAVKLGTACASTVLIPLLTPYHYDISSDSCPHPSETCSPLSRWWLYSWVDPVVSTSYAHSGELNMKELLPIGPQSAPTEWLEKYNDVCDTCGSFRETLWRLFRKRLVITASFMVLCGACEFIGTLGLRQLLLYLQGSPDAVFRPWFSILLFGLCPILRGLCMQTFEYFATHTIGHLKAVIISAVYQRLLRNPAGQGIAIGQLQNNISVDIDRLGALRYTVIAGFMVPVELSVASILLYKTIGWCYIPGLVFLLITRHPLSKFIVSAQGAAQLKILQATDERVAKISESIRHMATIAMLGQGQPFIRRILDKRSQELKAMWKKAEVIVVSESISTACISISLFLCLFLYTVVSKQPLEADVAFTVVAVFNLIKSMLTIAVLGAGQYAQAVVSLERLTEFLDSPKRPATMVYQGSKSHSKARIGFQDAAFGVTLSDGGSQTLLRNLNVEFVRKGLNVVTGNLGSGKTFLLESLLSEQEQFQGSVKLRKTPFEPIAYASQTPWFQSGSIRGNILFGFPFVQERYEDVLRACALEPDLASFEEGDLKNVGEGASTLSGGQRQRIALARAVYSNTEVVILDDVLSALDSATAKWVIDNCIFGPLMKDRTLILATDNPRCLEAADLIIYMADGTIKETVRKKPDETEFRPDFTTATSVVFTESIVPEASSENSSSSSTENTYYSFEGNALGGSKVVSSTPDTRRQGLIGTAYMFKYIRRFGNWPFILMTIAFLMGAQAMDIVLPAWLSLWNQAYTSKRPEVRSGFYLGMFAGLGTAQVTILAISLLLLYAGAWRVSREEHLKLLATVFGASYTWIISTPAGQIINRFSSDMMCLDDTLVRALRPVLETYLSIGFRIITVSSLVPIFLLPSLLFTGLAIYTGYRYRFAFTAAKRLYAASLSPLHHSITEAASGLVTIRAFRAEKALQNYIAASIEQHVRAWEAVSDLQRWLAVRMDIYASLISLSAAIFAFLRQGSNPSTVGLSLMLTTGLCTALLYLVYLSSLLEVEMNSLQRIDEYIEDIPQEPGQCASDGTALEDWPLKGDVDVQHLTVSYSLDGDEVLEDVSFRARPGERVAIVGRTGSGKSSLALSMLRLTTTILGSIRIDGVDIESLNVERLRRNISLVPQDPTLFNGTIRFNLDLSGAASDELLQTILDDVVGVGKLKLDDKVESNGQNFSQGERQLIALARAMVNQSKVVIIDEATASLDRASEERIQAVLRDKFRNCTIMAIAHRLDSVVDFDQVLVLDQGRIAERGHPQTLIDSKEGLFYASYMQQRRNMATE